MIKPEYFSSSKTRAYPNESEKTYLWAAYNCFYNDYQKIISSTSPLSPPDNVNTLSRMLRTYSECLKYKPLLIHVQLAKASESSNAALQWNYFELVRILFVHFDMYDSWDETKFSRALITWSDEWSETNKFLSSNRPHADSDLLLESEPNPFNTYASGGDIYLNELITEQYGVDLCLSLMSDVLESQLA